MGFARFFRSPLGPATNRWSTALICWWSDEEHNPRDHVRSRSLSGRVGALRAGVGYVLCPTTAIPLAQLVAARRIPDPSSRRTRRRRDEGLPGRRWWRRRRTSGGRYDNVRGRQPVLLYPDRANRLHGQHLEVGVLLAKPRGQSGYAESDDCRGCCRTADAFAFPRSIRSGWIRTSAFRHSTWLLKCKVAPRALRLWCGKYSYSIPTQQKRCRSVRRQRSTRK